MRRVLAVVAALAVTTVLVVIAPAGAITYGYVDQNNTYGNVGAFIVQSADGQNFPICSGTLISPTVFLTAGHCTSFFTDELTGYTAYVSFDSSIAFGSLTSRKTALIPALEVVTNPNYNQSQGDSGDLGVLLVSEHKTSGISPATLPTLGLLDRLQAEGALANAVFTAVGYGVQNRVVGGGMPFFQDQNPVPRMYSFSSFNSLNGGYIRLSQNPATGNGGTCYGDSGGPNFLDVNGSSVLAATTVTGDTACRSTNVDYRLDTPSARQFLGQFVTLP
jgi:Trypsin